MSTITDFSESFLPLEKMEQLLPEAKKTYAQAKPFPHIHFDDFFDNGAMDRVLKEFPNEGDIDWIKYYDGHQKKLANEKEEKINHKPEPVSDQDVAIGNSSKIDGGDYKLATEEKSYTSNYLPG